MLNYTEKPQNTYNQISMVTEILAREKCGLLWCLRTVYSVHDVIHIGICLTTKGWTQLHCYVMARCSSVTLVRYVLVYSGWKSVDNYDMSVSVFVVQFNGFMSLTS